MTKKPAELSKIEKEVGCKLSAREELAVAKCAEASRNSAPRLKAKTEGGVVAISTDHKSELVGYSLLMDAIGTTDMSFLFGLINQLGKVTLKGEHADESALNFMAAVVNGIQPRDQLEAMLAAQMAATHMAAMTLAGRLARAEQIPQQDSAERAFNKLARTFAMQLEALKRYRSSGEQKITVQRFSVEQGGQAIVGNVTHVQRGAAEKELPAPRALPALPDARATPMTILEEPAATRVARRKVER